MGFPTWPPESLEMTPSGLVSPDSPLSPMFVFRWVGDGEATPQVWGVLTPESSSSLDKSHVSAGSWLLVVLSSSCFMA